MTAMVVDVLGLVRESSTTVPSFNPPINHHRVDEFVRDLNGDFIGMLIGVCSVIISVCNMSMNITFGNGTNTSSSIAVDPQHRQRFPALANTMMQSRIASLMHHVETRFRNMVTQGLCVGQSTLFLTIEIGRVGEMHIHRTLRVTVTVPSAHLPPHMLSDSDSESDGDDAYDPLVFLNQSSQSDITDQDDDITYGPIPLGFNFFARFQPQQ